LAARFLMPKSDVYKIKQDIYWYKVKDFCEASSAMIQCYESKRAELSQTDRFDFIRVFENLGSRIDRVIFKHGILVGTFDQDLDELEKMRLKISAVLLVVNKKLDRSGVCV